MSLHVLIIVIAITLGILFLLIEIFLLPGVGIAGIAGVVFLVGGIAYAYIFIGNNAGNIALATSVIVLMGSFVWLIKSKALKKISLQTDIDAKVDNSEIKNLAVGDVGTAISRLNPIGNILINGVIVEGKSFDGEFIDEDSEVEVVKVETYNVLVRKKILIN
ncbi:MAG: NfeD family protein [Fermentimonas sp.]|jgi:membrane-bound ClpP family serine protease